jgi:hypothetical protein
MRWVSGAVTSISCIPSELVTSALFCISFQLGPAEGNESGKTAHPAKGTTSNHNRRFTKEPTVFNKKLFVRKLNFLEFIYLKKVCLVN